MGLQRTSEMHCALRSNVCSVSGFGRGETSEISVLGGSLDARRPFAISGAPANSYELALAVLVRLLSILLVQSAVSAAKIAYRVVQRIPVDMVKKIAGPFTVNVQPRDPMRKKLMAVNADTSVSLRKPSSFRAYAGVVSRVRFPDENAGVLIVIKKLAHALSSYHFVSHLASYLGHVGQRLTSVSALCGPRSF